MHQWRVGLLLREYPQIPVIVMCEGSGMRDSLIFTCLCHMAKTPPAPALSYLDLSNANVGICDLDGLMSDSATST